MEVVATAGHVDHGKSALVRALTGREPDRLAEERRRGLTIDLGYVWAELDGADGRSCTVAFVDVPGHDRFLTNMLAGVGAVQDVLLVVAADDGWSAQSEEHLEIVRLLGRRILAAAVTKAVPAGPGRTAEVVADVRRRLAEVGAADTGAETAGETDAETDAETPVLAVDALEPVGLDELRTTLVQRLCGTGPAGRGAVAAPGTPVAAGPEDATSFPRLWVDRVFTAAGAGTVVTGTLVAGKLHRGDRVAVLPSGIRGRIRELRSLEVSVDEAVAPARVAVALAGVDTAQVDRGDALVGLRRDGSPLGRSTAAMDVWLTALPHGTVGQRGAWQLHLGTARRDVRVRPLLGDLQPGEQGPARIEVEGSLPVQVGDRFVLREVGRRITAGGGTVLDTAPLPARRGTTARLVHAEGLEAVHDAVTLSEHVRALIALHGGSAAIDDLEVALGRPLGAGLRDDPALTSLEATLVERDRLTHWVEAATSAARAAPADRTTTSPLASRDQLEAAIVAQGCPRSLLPAVLRAALAGGEVVDVGGRVVHRAHHAAYLADRDQRQERLLAALDGPEPTCLDVGRVEEDHGVARFELQRLLDDGTVLQHDGVLFTPATVDVALARLDAGPGAGQAAFTASDARQAWGLTRKFAMPLLEHLRAAGFTTFDGTHHRRV